jgi:hypothetical protein
MDSRAWFSLFLDHQSWTLRARGCSSRKGQMADVLERGLYAYGLTDYLEQWAGQGIYGGAPAWKG